MNYKSSVAKNLLIGEEKIIIISKADVLIYYTEDVSKICVRPSGKEPEIKFYISVNTSLDSVENFAKAENILIERINNIIAEMQLS